MGCSNSKFILSNTKMESQPIISTEELSLLIDKDNVKILDCSVQFGRKEDDFASINYHKSHIKGALFLDLDNLKDMKSQLPYMMPDEKYFIDKMKVLGVKLTDKVVCYDTGAMQFFGYRAAWMFQAMGHPNVAVLDGGFPKWVTEKLPIESSDENIKIGDFSFKVQSERIWDL